MKNEITANSLSGRALGALILAGFGGAWLVLGEYVREQLSAAFFMGMAVFMLAVILASMILFRRAKYARREPDDPRIGKAFRGINTIQWIAIFIVASALHHYRHDEYTVSAIALIVGAHFLPLARIFQYRPHYVTGSVLMAWALWTAVAIPADTMQGVCAIGTGIILWASAIITLLLALISSGRHDVVQPIAG